MSSREILLVGTFHFEYLEELVKGKEEEIRQLVNVLADFTPSKVAVEKLRDEHVELNLLYKNIDRGYALNEVEQLGFRLAHRLQHKEIFTVDWEGKLTQEDVIALNHAIQEKYPDIQNRSTSYREKVEQILFDGNLQNTYKALNDIELVKSTEELYLSYVAVEDDHQCIGVDFLNKWFERELMIFKNIVEITSGENERILLIVGMDHLWMLKNLFEGSGWTVLNPFQRI